MITGNIPRQLAIELHRRLDDTPAVVLFGPRQAGKTTLALAEGEVRGARCTSTSNRSAIGPS